MSSLIKLHERAAIKVRRRCINKHRREYGKEDARAAVRAERRTMNMVLSMYRRWR